MNGRTFLPFNIKKISNKACTEIVRGRENHFHHIYIPSKIPYYSFVAPIKKHEKKKSWHKSLEGNLFALVIGS